MINGYADSGAGLGLQIAYVTNISRSLFFPHFLFPSRMRDCTALDNKLANRISPLKPKFHYASCFEASSKLVRAEIWPII